MLEVDPNTMRLPTSPIARPGETVRWLAQSRQMRGVVLGHDKQGLAIVKNQFDTHQHTPFDSFRPENPFERALPNWHSLPSGGRLLRPDEEKLAIFRETMRRIIAPGPTYQELAEEIWGRGFEVFLVGGTVRDILAGQVANDVDLVTTMPLRMMLRFLPAMFGTKETGLDRTGYIRLGGTPESGDPFIDLKVFSSSLPGTRDAMFGVGFDKDMSFRDFTMNALYFDPVNEVIIDPSGYGVADCEASCLRLVEGPHDRHQRGKIFIRGVKFVARGFEVQAETRERLVADYLPNVGALNNELRRKYFRTQVVSKHKSEEARRRAVQQFKDCLEALGCSAVWAEFFGYQDEDLQDA